MTDLRYDNSLPEMVNILARFLSSEEISAGVVVRDVTGRLSFFSASSLEPKRFTEIEHELQIGLGPYARPDRVLASGDDYGNSVLSDPTAYEIFVGSLNVRVVDRRLVGIDWLRRPAAPSSPPPRFVFASLKGGVGRSTALSVAALHLANQGKRILVFDLDMEAPGLSTMLLTPDTLPRFGIIDALVENSISGLDDAFMRDLIGSSTLASHSGRIDVVPAFGKASIDNPADILGKLARAYAENLMPDGKTSSMLDQIRDVVERLSQPSRYDAILIDARAGLHETSASAILGLGAELLFFGLNEEQTFQGYRALFAHLSRLRTKSTESDWLNQITMVQAKSSGEDEDQDLFVERCASLFQSTGFIPTARALDDVLLPAEPFRDVPWNDDASDAEIGVDEYTEPRLPLIILDDERFKHYSPQLRADLMLTRIYIVTFGSLLDRIDETIAAVADENGEIEHS